MSQVLELSRWPVKSLRGERVTAARFDERGMAGDRAYALLDERPNRAGNVLTVRQNQTLLSWSASYGDLPDPVEVSGHTNQVGSKPASYDSDWDLSAARAVTVRADSQLVVRQLEGRYRVKQAHLRPLYEEARSLARQIGRVTFEHVRREANVHADRLANRAMDEAIQA